MSELILRSVVWRYGAQTPAWQTKVYLAFSEAPCTPAAAEAHLALDPDNYVVLAGPRGPRGGWPVLRYLRQGDVLPKRSVGYGYSCHLARKA